jgi:hypothetical protein
MENFCRNKIILTILTFPSTEINSYYRIINDYDHFTHLLIIIKSIIFE